MLSAHSLLALTGPVLLRLEQLVTAYQLMPRNSIRIPSAATGRCSHHKHDTDQQPQQSAGVGAVHCPGVPIWITAKQAACACGPCFRGGVMPLQAAGTASRSSTCESSDTPMLWAHGIMVRTSGTVDSGGIRCQASAPAWQHAPSGSYLLATGCQLLLVLQGSHAECLTWHVTCLAAYKGVCFGCLQDPGACVVAGMSVQQPNSSAQQLPCLMSHCPARDQRTRHHRVQSCTRPCQLHSPSSQEQQAPAAELLHRRQCHTSRQQPGSTPGASSALGCSCLPAADQSLTGSSPAGGLLAESGCLMEARLDSSLSLHVGPPCFPQQPPRLRRTEPSPGGSVADVWLVTQHVQQGCLLLAAHLQRHSKCAARRPQRAGSTRCAASAPRSDLAVLPPPNCCWWHSTLANGSCISHGDASGQRQSQCFTAVLQQPPALCHPPLRTDWQELCHRLIKQQPVPGNPQQAGCGAAV